MILTATRDSAVKVAAKEDWASCTICFSICIAYDSSVKQVDIRESDFPTTPHTVDVAR